MAGGCAVFRSLASGARFAIAPVVMGRAPRFIPPNSMVEFTSRTINAMLLLRPSPELNLRILAILARALILYPVRLHAFVFLSNHWHALATVANAEQASRFLQYLNSNIAKAVQSLHGWSGTVWGRRGQIIPVVDDMAAEDRLRYILAHGAKEGLVASPLDWPGISCAAMLVRGEALVGVRRRSRRGTASSVIDADEYPIVLTPLPSWETLSSDERRARARAIVADIEQQARLDHPRPLGVEGVRRQDPLSWPADAKRSRAPLVHGSSAAIRVAFLQTRTAFVTAYRAAARQLAGGAAAPMTAMFPPGAFLPRLFSSPPSTPAHGATDRARGLVDGSATAARSRAPQGTLADAPS